MEIPSTFWSKARSKRLSIVVLLALSLAVILLSFSDTTNTSSVRRGDFPAFYAAAKLVADNQAQDLYSDVAQAKIEQSAWPSLGQSYLAFAYPPHVAVLLSPLANFNPLTAKLIFCTLSIAALVLATCVAAKIYPQVADNFAATFTLALAFGPVFSGIVAGQNIALTMLLYVGVMYFFFKGRNIDEYWAGACIGLLFFKPHFAALFLIAVILAGKYRAALSAAAVISVEYFIGASLLGASWPLEWLIAVAKFAALDYQANAHQMLSIHVVFLKWGELLGFSANVQQYFSFVPLLLAISLAVFTLHLFFQTRKLDDANKRTEALLSAFIALGPCVVLVAIHTLYYDLGLCLFALLLPLSRAKQINFTLALWAIVFLLTMLRENLSWQPLVIVAFLAYLRANVTTLNLLRADFKK